MKEQITITPDQGKGLRLDKFLVNYYKNFSRNYLQKAIENGKVLVNKKTVTPHYFLKEGDILKLNITPPPIVKIKPNKQVKFKVIKEDKDFLVIDKPAGLVVHPAEGVHEPTLVDGLLAHYPKLAAVGEDKLRPGIVHRLDREVSGLLVVAKNQEMFNHLKKQFQERTIDKEYIGLVLGQVQTPSGIIDFPLARSKTKHGKTAARPHEDEGIEATTHFEVIKLFKNFTLLKIKIATGRTHQIRAHLAAFSHPIVGDKLYKPAKWKVNKNLGRLFLHASKLAFLDLQNKRQEFVSSLPIELENFLINLQ